MNKRLSPYMVSVILLMCLALGPGLNPPALAASGESEAEKLLAAGLSPDTLRELDVLLTEDGRARPPAVTIEDVHNLLAAGFNDELVRLMVKLDRASGGLDQMPITPEQAVILSGSVSMNTIRTMLMSEINRIEHGTAKEKKDRILTSRTETRADGRNVIVYGSVDSGIGKRMVTTPDGREVILYYSGDPGHPAPDFDEQQKDELARAWKLLERLRLIIVR